VRKILSKIWIKFLTILAAVRISKYPPFIYYDYNTFTITGNNIDAIKELLQPGDLILRGFDDFIGSILIGRYSHIGLVIDSDLIIHAIEPVVTYCHLYDFCKCDRIIILRPKLESNKHLTDILITAHSLIGTKYDFNFDFENSTSFSCTEFIAYCFKDYINIQKETIKILGLFKKEVIKPETFIKHTEYFEKVY
jgi:hypothetical protein